MRPDPCLSSADLAAFHRGAELPPGAADRLADHLADCSRCEAVLQALDAGERTEIVAIRRLAAAPAAGGLTPGVAAGTVVGGRYKLVEPVGEGGMGSVWMAQQTEPVRRAVAVKLIKPGMDSKLVLARFAAERQALALMDHPNIARVFDGGQTEFGRPYFVMELVKGVPVTRYCDAHKLTPRDRLRLFVPVCQAVQHAHQKGVIHRDLKPSNVLVARYDDRPVPKVIDFGVAKAAGQPLTDRTLMTGFGAVVGTPEYMSPEQAAFNALDVDTRSDVYALGVLLYELLTGTTPLTRPDSPAGLVELLKVLREQDPPRPSARLSDPATLPAVADARGTDPGRLAGQVRGELDWIVMRALEKDRGRRYQTASGLAADVERYLAGEPVEAVPPSTVYRVRTFARRHRRPVLAAGLLLLALVAGVVGTTAGLLRAVAARRDAQTAQHDAQTAQVEEAIQRTIAETARADAIAREADADAVIRFVDDSVFAASRPKGENGGLGHDATLRAALAAALPAVDAKFKDQPLVEARLRHSFGLMYLNMGDATKAAEQFERERALRVGRFAPDHADTLVCLDSLAECYALTSRQPDALRLYEEVAAGRQRAFGPYASDTLLSRHRLAACYNQSGRRDEALRLWEETAAVCRRALPADHPVTLSTLGGLSKGYDAAGRKPDALRLREEVAAGCERVYGLENSGTLTALWALAQSYADAGRKADALRLYEQVATGRYNLLGAHHPRTVIALHFLRIALTDAGRLAEAAACARKCAVCSEGIGWTEPETLFGNACFRALASGLYARADQPAEAAADADRAMDWLTKAVAAGYADTRRLATWPDLAPLRGRPDYRRLAADLAAKHPPGPELAPPPRPAR